MATDPAVIQQQFSLKEKRLNLSPKYEDADYIARQVTKRRLTQAQADLIPVLMEAAEIAYPGKWDIQFDYHLDYKRETDPDGYGLWTMNPIDFNRVLNNNNVSEQELYNLAPNYVIENLYRRNAGEDRVYDFKITITYVTLIVHFPEVTISNKFRQTHDIKNLFIKLKFNHRGEVTTDLQGTRSSYSELEVKYNYVHSHLRAVDFHDDRAVMNWQNFCKGSGSINACLQLYNTDKSLGNLLSLLYHLNSTANHESIDGGPHYRMENLLAKEGLATAPSSSNVHEVYYKIVSNVVNRTYSEELAPIIVGGEEHKMLPLDWKYEAGKYVIIDNDKLNDFCVYYLKHNSNFRANYCVFKADNGQYYKKPSALSFDRRDYPEHYTNFIPFKGQRYEFNIYSKPGPAITDKKVYIHPEIRKYVKQQLESYAAKAAFKQSAIERLDQISNH